MQLALISDIHGNYKALEAFLEYIEDKEIDHIICLGDMVTDSPNPRRALDLLHEMAKKYPTTFIRGNREQYLIDNFYHPQGWKPYSSATGSLWHTARQITEEDIRFFESLPISARLDVEGCPPTMLCHGSPKELRGNVLEDPSLKEKMLKELKEDYLLGGHSHNRETETVDGKTYLNPGSLGLAIDGVGAQAPFCLLKVNGGYEITFVSIPYDVEGYLKDFEESGLDEYGCVLNRAIKKTLRTGINYFYKTVMEAIHISGKPIGEIPEEVWEQAAAVLEV